MFLDTHMERLGDNVSEARSKMEAVLEDGKVTPAEVVVLRGVAQQLGAVYVAVIKLTLLWQLISQLMRAPLGRVPNKHLRARASEVAQMEQELEQTRQWFEEAVALDDVMQRAA